MEVLQNPAKPDKKGAVLFGSGAVLHSDQSEASVQVESGTGSEEQRIVGKQRSSVGGPTDRQKTSDRQLAGKPMLNVERSHCLPIASPLPILQPGKPIEPARPEAEPKGKMLPPGDSHKGTQPEPAQVQRPLDLDHHPIVVRCPPYVREDKDSRMVRHSRQAERLLHILPVRHARLSPLVAPKHKPRPPDAPQLPLAVNKDDEGPGVAGDIAAIRP